MTICYNCQKPRDCTHELYGEPLCDRCGESLIFCGLPVKGKE